MATSTTSESLTIHAPTPRPASSIMLNVLSSLSSASGQAPSQPPKPSVARPTTRTHLARLETRQLLREKVNAAISRRIDASKNTVSFPSSPRRGRRSSLTTAAPRIPLGPTVALHNAKRRTSLIPARERGFRARPRPAALGQRILSRTPTLPEDEVFPPLPPGPLPTDVLGHPMVRTKATRPRPRPRRPIADENTVPFPTEMPALPSALPTGKARRTARAASYSLPRVPFAPLVV